MMQPNKKAMPNLFVMFLRTGLALLSLESTCTKTRRASSTAKSCEEDAEKFVAWKFGGQRYDGRDQVLLLAEDKPRFKKSGRGDIPDSDSE
ncbi:uncharacterized protein J4E79_006624 [Alternaria viburni]|uniref:uncharacterized protein n=1 Tax=Alternaria viburni TaxID=566460 RepID=UPI0020C362F1|nr:uncharacterized protein J4E79_006624 [Alternaria viburni]KAI4658865.1 hypothetical protein J4E79_006624 [Alternaria viburni]